MNHVLRWRTRLHYPNRSSYPASYLIMGRWTIQWLKNVEPSKRLLWAVWLFWASIFLGILSTIFLCDSGFERVLMAISWGAITITCIDIVATTDVRDEGGG